MIPTAELRAEYHPSNPPRLVGFHVIVDGKTVAVLPADQAFKSVQSLKIDRLKAELFLAQAHVGDLAATSASRFEEIQLLNRVIRNLRERLDEQCA
jgi:hypothetical protein